MGITSVSVERYARKKYLTKANSPVLYYIRQKTKDMVDIDTLATAIEESSSLTAGDVTHTIKAFVKELRKQLVRGSRVKIDGLGTFHITVKSDGTEKEEDCKVRCIKKVNVRFLSDKALKLVNATYATSDGPNNVSFALDKSNDDEVVTPRPDDSDDTVTDPLA